MTISGGITMTESSSQSSRRPLRHVEQELPVGFVHAPAFLSCCDDKKISLCSFLAGHKLLLRHNNPAFSVGKVLDGLRMRA